MSATWPAAVEAPASAGAFDGRFAPLREAAIMMVDDDSIALEVLRVYLEEAGFENIVAIDDSTTALGRIAADPPDVLLLDLMMPVVGGMEILSALREDEALRHLPVLILTASTDAGTKLRALELGATDFLAKPVDASELTLRLRNTLAAKAYQDRLAYYDGPTGLPNRDLFARRLERELNRSRRGAGHCAVLNLGLRRFDMLSHALGSATADRLLGAVGERLELHLQGLERAGADALPARAEITVARGIGSQFMLLVPDAKGAAEAGQIARSVLAELGSPFPLDGRELFVNPFIGIAVHPDDGADAAALLAHANAATRQGMQGAGPAYHYFSEELNSDTLERVALEHDLHQALDRGELELYFQPKLTIADTPRVIGAEALLRWRHPERGMVPTGEFVPVAEETGLIVEIGAWVLRTACRQAVTWEREGLGPLRVAVNVSARQLAGGGLVETVEGALAAAGLPGDRLVVEVTESAIIANPAAGVACLEAIKALGVRISVDDFGTGYSSLTYIKRFPVDELKIDRSFVRDLPSVRDDLAITTAIITMARGLGLKVVAEGIETEAQLECLRGLGCDTWQGFLCSRPVRPAEFADLLRSRG